MLDKETRALKEKYVDTKLKSANVEDYSWNRVAEWLVNRFLG